MSASVIQIPVSLLLDPALSPPAKLVWLVARMHASPQPASIAWLASRSRLSCPTVRSALAKLRAAGRAATGATEWTSQGGHVSVPGALLSEGRVGPQAKILYGALQCTPGYWNRAGQFSYTLLSQLTGATRPTVRRAVRELTDSGWLQAEQLHQQAPFRFLLLNPRYAEVTRAKLRLRQGRFRGESLMREYLNLLVDSKAYEDNHYPPFLINPYTGERLQLDRHYSLGVAFEFNGAQHYDSTAWDSPEDFAKQQARDDMKLGICTREGIHLIIVLPGELNVKTLREKIGNSLPLRDLAGHERLIGYLESVSKSQRSKPHE